MTSHVLADRSDIHLMRKLWHISWGVSGLVAYFYYDMTVISWGWICLVVSLFGFALDFIRFKNPAFNNKFIKIVGPLMRQSEKTSFSGLPFYALGISLSAFFYSDSIALIAICFLIFSDPIASIFGVTFGKEMILPNKSLVGTLANFFSCYIITMIFVLPLEIGVLDMLLFSTICAIIGSLSELLSAFNVDDNLTIPVVSGAGITLVNTFMGVF